MEEKIGINLLIPIEFSIELDRHLIDLKESGVRKSKAELIIEMARIGFSHEKQKK
jgi:hypothetical protein